MELATGVDGACYWSEWSLLLEWMELATGVDEVDKACYWSGWSFLLEWMRFSIGVDGACNWSG